VHHGRAAQPRPVGRGIFGQRFEHAAHGKSISILVEYLETVGAGREHRAHSALKEVCAQRPKAPFKEFLASQVVRGLEAASQNQTKGRIVCTQVAIQGQGCLGVGAGKGTAGKKDGVRPLRQLEKAEQGGCTHRFVAQYRSVWSQAGQSTLERGLAHGQKEIRQGQTKGAGGLAQSAHAAFKGASQAGAACEQSFGQCPWCVVLPEKSAAYLADPALRAFGGNASGQRDQFRGPLWDLHGPSAGSS
jgi:hypothetical protein